MYKIVNSEKNFGRGLLTVIFFFVLMLSLSQASIAEIYSVSVLGSSGINNFVKNNEVLTVTAVASIGSSIVSPSQIMTDYKGEKKYFVSCYVIDSATTDPNLMPYVGLSLCTTTIVAGQTPASGVEQVKISLYDMNQQMIPVSQGSPTFDVNLYYDNRLPTVMSMNPIRTNGVVTGLDISANDTACIGSGCAGKCSGITKAEIYTGSYYQGLPSTTPAKSITFTESSGQITCARSFSLDSGFDMTNQDITVLVYDGAGNVGRDVYQWNPLPILKNLVVTGSENKSQISGGIRIAYVKGVRQDEVLSKGPSLLSYYFYARKGSQVLYGMEFAISLDGNNINTYPVCRKMSASDPDLVGFYNCSGMILGITTRENEVPNYVHEIKASFRDVQESSVARVVFDTIPPKISLFGSGWRRDALNDYTISIVSSDDRELSRLVLFDGMDNFYANNPIAYEDPARILKFNDVPNPLTVTDYKIPKIIFAYTGYKNIIVKVYDIAGNSNYTNVSLLYDVSVPESNGKYYLYTGPTAGDVEYKFVSPYIPKTVRVAFTITDGHALTINRVDASALTDNPALDYRNIPVSCTTNGNIHRCVSQYDLEVFLQTLSGKNIYVNVTDELGSKKSFELTPAFGLDSADPVPTELKVGNCDADFGCFVGNIALSKISLKINEAGAGFYIDYCFSRIAGGACSVAGKNVKVDVSKWIANVANSLFVLNACDFKDGAWDCFGYFNATGTKAAFLENETGSSRVDSIQDDAGNSYRDTTLLSANSIGDTNAPHFTSLTIVPTGGADATGGDGIHVRQGDFIKINATVMDLSPVTIFLNVSNILPDKKNPIEVKCTFAGNVNHATAVAAGGDYASLPANVGSRLWKCEWQSDSAVKVPTSGPNAYTAGVTGTAYDLVGHKKVVLNNDPVYLLDSAKGSHVTVSISKADISPSYLNRRLITISPYRIRVPFVVSKLSGTHASLGVLSMRYHDCSIAKDKTNEKLYFAGVFSDIIMTPTVSFSSVSGQSMIAKSNSIYRMKRTLNENDYVNSIAWINTSCKIDVFVGYRDSVSGANYMYDVPDTLDFNWTITLKDSLYEPGEKIMEKIEKLNQTASNMSWLYPTLTFIQTAQGICKLGTSLSNVLYPISAAGGALQTAAGVLEAIGVVPYVKPIYEFVSTSAKSLTDISSNFQMTIDGFFDSFGAVSTSEGGSEKKSSGIIRNLCNLVNCEQCNDPGNNWIADAGSNGLENFLNGDGTGVDLTMGGLLQATPAAADWKSSFLVSVGCGCLPGIVLKMEEHRQMVCEQMTCLRDKASLGLDVSECELTYQRAECKYWMGEISQLGPTRVLDAYFGSAPDLNTLIINKIGGIPSALCKATKTAPQDDAAKALWWGACELPKTVNTVTDIVNRTIELFQSDVLGQIGDYFANYVNSWGGLKGSFEYSDDACEEWVTSPRLGIPEDILNAEIIATD